MENNGRVPFDPIMTDEELEELYHQELQPPQMYYEFCEAPTDRPVVTSGVRRILKTVGLLTAGFVFAVVWRYL